MKRFFRVMPVCVLACGIMFSACSNPASDDGGETNSKLYELVTKIGFGYELTAKTQVRLNWNNVPQEVADNDAAYGPAGTYANATGHLQGMVKVKDGTFWASTVYVTTSPGSSSPTAEEAALGMDRGPGAGVGYVVNFRSDGTEIKRVKVGEGRIYHPGGIDYDGEYIWVPVAEYRPNSNSILYKIDPEAAPDVAATEVMRVPDHIGGLLHDVKNNTIIGNTWGSRRFYTWRLNSSGMVNKTTYTREELAGIKVLNRAVYVDFQDNMYAGNGKMIASGIQGIVGGIEVLDCKTGLIEHQIRIAVYVKQGAVTGTASTDAKLCQNPFWLEVDPADETNIIAYFAPEDDSTYLYIYNLKPGNHPNASIVKK